MRLRAAVALLAGCAVLAGGASSANAADEPKHPHMHHALHELDKARVELKEAAHDFGGHREKTIKALDEAIAQVGKALEGAGDKYTPGKGPDKEVYKKYESYPHMHHALHELGEAHKELKEAKHDFGGHREKAIKDVDHAIAQLETALKFKK